MDAEVAESHLKENDMTGYTFEDPSRLTQDLIHCLKKLSHSLEERKLDSIQFGELAMVEEIGQDLNVLDDIFAARRELGLSWGTAPSGPSRSWWTGQPSTRFSGSPRSAGRQPRPTQSSR